MQKLLIALRVLLIFEIVMQPFAVWWMIIIAGRIRADQEQIRQFVRIWGTRLLRTSTASFKDLQSQTAEMASKACE